MNKTVNIDWKPNKESDEPVYRQIFNYMSKKVSAGDWAVGSKLPPQRELAKAFEVNRSTVVMAIEELKSYGIMEGLVGSGVIVAGNTWSILMSTNESNWGSHIKSGYFMENLPTIQAINEYEFVDDIRRLGTGEMSPELFPKGYFNKALGKMAGEIESLNYLGPLGLPELRETIVERLKRFNINVNVNNVLITSGSLQALQLISVCMLKKESTVYCEVPSYINSLRVFQSEGIKMSGIGMDEEGIRYWNMNEENTNYDAALYTIPTNQNPTGQTMSEKRRKELYNFCKSNRIPIIEDDVYGELSFDFEPPNPIKSLDDNGVVLYLGSVSKSFVPGLRVGWVVGPESVVERMGDVKMQVDYGASSISQLLLNELFTSGDYDRYIEENKARLRRRRDLMLSSLDKYFLDLGKWEKPLGGFYVWVELNNKISMENLFKTALGNKILINPGYIYDIGNKNRYLRMSYVYLKEEEIEGTVRDLSKIIKEMIKKKS